ncbi:P-loop containing nucleoside triphosphate hydrolase protein [Auricularia subglabra TFB-10046 SS5]|uniref:p-loop containing nucleoside triphosphate hydrolase protein n=1 Tax=Auricularia subglabra (strain TFB-10046 / SS5) TaxID=717982 RepID=J0D8S8_AURST|nr:P-loop containing nucleoside triphosphate hydrolase protein [Auricularia subglabra TFB-10046 SS5]
MACPNDLSLGPAASCRTLDFTLGFEYRVLFVLHYALSCLLLAHLASHTAFTHARVTKHRLDPLMAAKLLAAAVGVAVTATVLAYSNRALADFPGLRNWASAGYALQMGYVVLLASGSYLRHTRNIAPSTALALTLILSVLFGIAHVRTLLIASVSPTLAALSVVVLAWQITQLVLELLPKRRFLNSEHLPKAKEATSSVVSRLAFTFLFPLLLRGRKEALSLDDLSSFGIPPPMTAEAAGRALSDELAQTKAHRTPWTLIKASLRTFLGAFLAPVVPKLALVGATFAQPFIVQAMLSFISSYATEGAQPVHSSRGWALVGAYALVYFTMAASTAFYFDKVYAAAMQYRAALITIIYEKSLRLSANMAQTEGSGAAVVYMSVDVERVVEGTTYIHEAWAALLSITLAAIIMWYQASYAMLSTMAVICFFLVVTTCVASVVEKSQMGWMEATNARVKFITSAVSNIIPIKLSAIEAQFPARTSALRNTEVDRLKHFFRRLVSVAVLSTATVNVAGVAALGTYVALGLGGPLEPAKLFTILTVVNLLTLPISTIGHVFPQILASLASFRRIAGFLAAEEKGDLAGDDNHWLGPVPRVAAEVEKGDSVRSAASAPRDISLAGACFATGLGSLPVLEDLNITIGDGKLTMLVGPVGSGKSVLLRSLLKETYLVRGSCTFPAPGSVSYVAQDAFIFPASVRANIVLGQPFEPSWYKSVLTACALDSDIASMPQADMTHMGDKGDTVSGGQKQRIALARAVYTRSPVTLLDDCFSALDAHTASNVFDSLFGPIGLLRGRTVLLATHILSHLTIADDIIVLEAGQLVAQGTFDTLRASAIDVDAYTSQKKHNKSAGGSSSPQTAVVLEDEVPIPIPAVVEEARPASVQSNDDADEDGASLKLNTWAPYKFYFRACEWNNLILTAVTLLCAGGLEIGLQIYLKEWSQAGGYSHTAWLLGYASFAVACAVATGLSFTAYTQTATPHASRSIHSQMISAALSAPVAYFHRIPPSRLVNRFTGDVNAVDFTFPISLLDFAFSFTFILGSMVLICLAVPWLAIAMPALLYAYYTIQKFYLATSQQFQRLEMSSKSPLFGTFNTALSGIVTIRAFGAQDLFLRQGAHHLDRSQMPMYYRYAGIRFLRTTLSFCTLFVAVCVALLAVGLRRSTSAGFLGVTLSQLVGFSQGLQNLILAWTRVENGIVSVERVREVTNAPAEPKRDADAADGSPTQWPALGKIEFRNVCLKYKEDLEPALKNMSFTIRGGEKMGICGRTGSGKSSTVLALLAGVDPSLVTGEILIDDVDIKSVQTDVLRSSISLVSQTPSLFYLSIRKNLTVGFPVDTPPSDDVIWSVLERVGMREAVNKLPGKLDAVLSSDGMEFSRGERQLLCIARVLLEKRKIVILDEASSSMDMQTDARLRIVLQTHLKDCTVIAVAHRLSSIVDFDAVAVLEKGQLVEHGAPRELLARPATQFAKLAKTQGITA